MRRCACTRATPKPKYIQYFLRLSLCFFPYVPSFFTLLRYLVPLYPHLSNFLSSFYNHSDFRISKSRSLLRRLVFRQPPSPFLSLVSFLFYNRSDLLCVCVCVFFLSTGIFGFSCRRVWAPPHLPYKSRHSDFFFCFIFFSGDFLFICRTRS